MEGEDEHVFLSDDDDDDEEGDDDVFDDDDSRDSYPLLGGGQKRGERAVTEYRMTMVVVHLGSVELDLGCSTFLLGSR